MIFWVRILLLCGLQRNGAGRFPCLQNPESSDYRLWNAVILWTHHSSPDPGPKLNVCQPPLAWLLLPFWFAQCGITLCPFTAIYQLMPRQTPNCTWLLSLFFYNWISTVCLDTPTFRILNVHVTQVFLCSVRESFLNCSSLTCKFKGRDLEVLSCHHAT